MEHIEDLHVNSLKIIQDDQLFKFGTDAVLLSRWAEQSIKSNSKVIDLGTGNGIIPLLLSAFTNAPSITGLELQEKSAELAQRNVQLNHLEDRIKIVKGDMADIKKYFEPKQFDVIVSNPPYMKWNRENENALEAKTIARHEVKCTTDLLCQTVKYLLKDNGKFILIHRPDRLAALFNSLNKNGLMAKRLRFVTPDAESKPTMFLLEARKNADSEMLVEKNLVMYEKKGLYTPEVQEIYRPLLDPKSPLLSH